VFSLSGSSIRRAFCSGVGAVYLCAFLSLWVQVDGLIGSAGILPAARFLEAAGAQLGAERFHDLPTLLWWLPPTDTTLQLLCGGGALLSVLLMLGFAPVPIAALLWVDYLSLFTVSRVFLGFQWDILLLEMGFACVFYAPLSALTPRSRAWRQPASRAMTWVLRLLIFKLMFSSGVVKLSSGDPTWWNLTALSVHYETTCLPTWTGWYMHQLPLWFHRVSTAGMFVVELVLPFLVFGPRPLRCIAAAGFTALMLFIAATGNYGFFNLQAIVLCLPLLADDRTDTAERSHSQRHGQNPFDWPRPVTWPLALAISVLSLVAIGGAFRVPLPWPGAIVAAYDWQRPFCIVNGYGLFANMTTQRPEIIVEGSNDGETWMAYTFKWKPGDPRRRPRFVEPHMPRLDWRMWFAALGNAAREGWFYPFCARLLEGSRPVLDLLATNPFPDTPPRYLRAELYDYRFTRLGEETDAWWERRRLGPYTPILTLAPNGGLRAVDR
jgi:hypothetical protein